MSKEQFIMRLSMILTNDDFNRISVHESDDGLELTIDLHYLRCLQAQTILKNIIALNRFGFSIHAIHGFNHGTAIKEMLTRQSRLNHRFSNIYSPAWNPGETYIQIAAIA